VKLPHLVAGHDGPAAGADDPAQLTPRAGRARLAGEGES